MKIEKRGKYPGVKVHLDEGECEELLAFQAQSAASDTSIILSGGTKFLLKLSKKIDTLIQEEPNLLKPRTDEEIHHELEVELESAQKKIAALKAGGDWKGIHLK